MTPIKTGTPTWAIDTMHAEVGFAVRRKDIFDRHAGGLLHFLVAVDEVAPEARRETAPDGSLARSHHAHEHDRPSGQQRRQLITMRVLLRCRGSHLAGPQARGG